MKALLLIPVFALTSCAGFTNTIAKPENLLRLGRIFGDAADLYEEFKPMEIDIEPTK